MADYYNRGVARKLDSSWKDLVFSKNRLHILNMLRNSQDAMEWFNNMQSEHANLRQLASDLPEGFINHPYTDERVKSYQNRFSNGFAGKNFNDTGILNAYQSGAFNVLSNNPNSKDRPSEQWVSDGKYSGITDWRYLLGRDNDWDKNSDEFKLWQRDLNSVGYETYKDKDNYYKLRRLSSPKASIALNPNAPIVQAPKPGSDEDPIKPEIQWGEFPIKDESFKIPGLELPTKKPKQYGWLYGVLPNLLSTTRLGLNLFNNKKVANYYLQANKPLLRGTYHLHHQLIGDEALKQSYYQKAAQTQTLAALPFTSDADKLMAYLMEALANANQLRTLGDLADNEAIRRHAEISEAKADANKLRDSETANLNNQAIREAALREAEIKALRSYMDTQSWDSYIKDLLAKLIAANLKRLENAKYEELLALENDPVYQDLLNLRQAAYNKAAGDTLTEKKMDSRVREAEKALEKYRLERQIRFNRQNYLLFAKKGGTIKMLQGGGIPFFTSYTPLETLNEGSTTTTTSSDYTSSKKSEKDNPKKDMLGVISKLFTDLKGLYNDVDYVSKSLNDLILMQHMTGEDLDYDDLASLYVSYMGKMSLLKDEQDAFNNATSHVNTQNAGGEIAVTSDGKVVTQNIKTREIEALSLEDINPNVNRIFTNRELLSFRRLSPSMVFNLTYLQAIDNATSLNKITEYLKSNLMRIGVDELLQEGYSKKEADRILGGVLILLLKAAEGLSEAPDGTYKETYFSKDLENQALFALDFLYNSLNPALKTILKFHHSNPKKLIESLVFSTIDNTKHYDFDAVTGKAASTKKDGSESSDSAGGIKATDPLIALLGIGSPETIRFNTGTPYEFLVESRTGHLGENLGNGSVLEEVLNKSPLSKMLEFSQATMGGYRLDMQGFNMVVLNESLAKVVDLPYKLEHDNTIVPDFSKGKNLEKADSELRELAKTLNITPELQNEIYKKHDLPTKFVKNEMGEWKINRDAYGQFVAIQGQADERAFVGGDVPSSPILKKLDEDGRDTFERRLKKYDEKYSVDRYFAFDIGWGKDIVEGTIFIPFKPNAGLTDVYKSSDTKMEDLISLLNRYEREKDIIHKPAYVDPEQLTQLIVPIN